LANINYLGGQVPYIKDADFARVVELTQLIKELAQKESYPSIPDIADRVLKIMVQYEARIDSHSSLRDVQRGEQSRNKD
jgi:hypothetical protein